MKNIESFIDGSTKLTDIFGYWPSFHDAEVIELGLLRGDVEPEAGRYVFPILKVQLHVWELTEDTNSKGFSYCGTTNLPHSVSMTSASSEWKDSITRMPSSDCRSLARIAQRGRVPCSPFTSILLTVWVHLSYVLVWKSSTRFDVPTTVSCPPRFSTPPAIAPRGGIRNCQIRSAIRSSTKLS
jgi:hypothetical protein